MKKAFTLVEIVIALGIVSVLAVLLAGNLQSSRPNDNKIKYIQSYDALREAVSYLVNDSSFYPPIYQTNIGGIITTYNFSEIPLLNIDQPVNETYHNQQFEGVNKFCNLLRESLDGTVINNCSDAPGAGTFNFRTTNNVHWVIDPTLPIQNGVINAAPNVDNFSYFLVTIDVNGLTDGPNATGGNNPDQFEFLVSTDGNVYPRDVQGQAHIRTRNNYKNRAINIGGLAVKNFNDPDLNIVNSFTRQ